MGHYVLRRLGWLVFVLTGVSVLTFSLGVLAPGDPAYLVLERELGHEPTQAQVEARRQVMGLDEPVAIQYVTWLSGAVQGDLGASWTHERGVFELLVDRLPRTALLAFASLSLAVVLGIPLGILSAWRRRSLVDHSARVAALVGVSIPNYVLGYLLMIAVALPIALLPVYGFGTPAHLVLPAVTLGTGVMALLSRLTRASLLEVLGEDYMQVARAKGLSGFSLIFRHGLPNALIPVLTMLGLYMGHLLGGAVIVETVFSWPGLGQLGLTAIHQRDYPLIQGFVLFSALIYVIANLLTDLSYAWFDPRVRLGSRTEAEGTS